MTRKQRFAPLAVAGMVAAASSCGAAPSSMQIGVRRVGVDLAFQADKEAGKKPPKIVYIDEPPPLPAPVITRNVKNEVVILQPPVVTPIVNRCPKAGPGDPVERIATPSFSGRPKVGVYENRNKGRITIGGGLFPITLPYPTPSQERLENLVEVKDGLGRPVEGAYEYDVVTPAGANSTTDRRRFTPGTGIQLVKRTYVQDGTTVEFAPLKPITLVGLTTGEGNSWTDATSDPRTGITMTTQGQVGARERVDVCGVVVEAYRVSSTERLVSLNPSSPFASTTKDTDPAAPGKPNSYLVSPQYGGLFVQVETNMTTTIGAASVTIENVAIKSSIDPSPLK